MLLILISRMNVVKMNSLLTKKNRNAKTDLTILAGLAIVIMFFVATGFVSYTNTQILNRNAKSVTHTHEVIKGLDQILSLMKDAETGQRGYLLTGELIYLQPYNAALLNLEESVSQIESLTRDNLAQQTRLPLVKTHIATKLRELEESIALRRAQGFDAALELMKTDVGQGAMDALRTQIAGMQNTEQSLRQQRLKEMEAAFNVAIASGILAGLLGVLLSLFIGFLMRRAAVIRQNQQWLQLGQVGLGNAMFGEQRVEQLGENILKFLAEYFDAHAGAFFSKEGGSYRRVATYGVPADSNIIDSFEVGEGLLGQAAKDSKTFLMQNAPDGYLNIGSALGQGNPKHLIIAPATMDGGVNAVIELGFVHPVTPSNLELMERVAGSIGVAVRSANYRSNLQDLLEETQRQAEEMQTQGEELRVSNEELEEQSRALKESQSRLEQQQAELEQTNSQLEEQTQILETQRDDLEKVKTSVQMKAKELELASQYKSDFLANMSHELRTPLNSSLILAKLLADNPGGNLTTEQVKFAQTIQSSGNDLLTLINDILDLSKIEAGHMEIRPESFSIERMTKDLQRVFEPVAAQKKLAFKVTIEPGTPEKITTDRQRLDQVIKNLLSNAIKFTEKGSVELKISLTDEKLISISVIDTGIGIAKVQQQAIFDAFRQADGTISRKYGGTGLGLSISRELVRLLGGVIDLKSEPGKGSAFSVLMPPVYAAEKIEPRVLPVAAQWDMDSGPITLPESGKKSESKATPTIISTIEDDRQKLTSNKRVILVVEDDESFAAILYDLILEMGFHCLIATSAEEALNMAKEFMPHAVLLDVGLPDNSGLSVLDRLKRDSHLRHIPVHVVSASDYTETALSLGAIGYMIKPVKRDELISALKKLEERFDQQMRRILIVEDDQVQRESLQKLLGADDVDVIGVGTAAECLENLRTLTFDCMVLDLSLPDASGYALLETLSQEDSYSFPPVIVYTGRDLTSDQEQRLRRYSKSIIIKGAKSPERLLNEVTLFLHRVVSDLPAEHQKMLETVRNRDAVLESRQVLIVEDDVANIYALTSILEPRGVHLQVARNGLEALDILKKSSQSGGKAIDLVLMDMMMPEMDGLTATREIRKMPEWKKLPIIMLTAKAMRDDQDRCLNAGANDYMAKPLDVEKLLSLVRVWMPR